VSSTFGDPPSLGLGTHLARRVMAMLMRAQVPIENGRSDDMLARCVDAGRLRCNRSGRGARACQCIAYTRRYRRGVARQVSGLNRVHHFEDQGARLAAPPNVRLGSWRYPGIPQNCALNSSSRKPRRPRMLHRKNSSWRSRWLPINHIHRTDTPSGMTMTDIVSIPIVLPGDLARAGLVVAER
jgi:hypothetical protein